MKKCIWFIFTLASAIVLISGCSVSNGKTNLPSQTAKSEKLSLTEDLQQPNPTINADNTQKQGTSSEQSNLSTKNANVSETSVDEDVNQIDNMTNGLDDQDVSLNVE